MPKVRGLRLVFRSEEIGARLITFLNNWVMSRRLGRITGSSAGFIIPSIEDGDSKKETYVPLMCLLFGPID